MPVQWDMDDEITERAFIEWMYEYRKNVFSVSSRADAIIEFIDSVKKRNSNITIVYTTKGAWPPVYFSRVAIHFLGRANNIHQPNFDEDNLNRLQIIDGGEELKTGLNVAVHAGGRLTVYDGKMDSESVIRWVESRFFNVSDGAKDEN